MLNKKDKNIDNEVIIKHVSMDDIVEIMNENKNYIILDVRTIAEYNEGHIPNAICIPNETIGSNTISELPDKEQLILVYCRSGNRSKKAAEKLKAVRYLFSSHKNCTKKEERSQVLSLGCALLFSWDYFTAPFL